RAGCRGLLTSRGEREFLANHAVDRGGRHCRRGMDVLKPMRAAARRALALVRSGRERRARVRLAPLYAPDADHLGVTRHVREAMSWLKRAQDAGVDRGVSYGVYFGDNFDVSYPETTGYICSTFVEHEGLTGDGELLRRAIEMGDWEIAVQLPDGAVM